MPAVVGAVGRRRLDHERGLVRVDVAAQQAADLRQPLVYITARTARSEALIVSGVGYGADTRT